MGIFSKLKSTVGIMQNLDLDKIGKLAANVDLNKMIGLVSSMRVEDFKTRQVYESGKKKHDCPKLTAIYNPP